MRAIERMSEVTVIQVVKGDDNSGTRRHLNDAQRAGQACVVFQGTENLTRHVGWVDGVSIRVHSYHLENYRLGETLPPPAA
jgi:hypothetical protein